MPGGVQPHVDVTEVTMKENGAALSAVISFFFFPRQPNLFCFNNTKAGMKEGKGRGGTALEHTACSALTLQIRRNVKGFKLLWALTADADTM